METSVPQASLVLACHTEVVKSCDFYSERSQEVDLFEPLQEVLTGLPEGESLTSVVVGTGPGSYNGSRVGIASAQAIAQVHRCGVAGLSSFEGLHELIVHSGQSWAVGDARRGALFYLALAHGRVVGVPQLLEPEAFAAWIQTEEGPFMTFENPERLGEFPQVKQGVSTAANLLKSWLSREEEEKNALISQELEAFYLRAPHITKAKSRKKR